MVASDEAAAVSEATVSNQAGGGRGRRCAEPGSSSPSTGPNQSSVPPSPSLAQHTPSPSQLLHSRARHRTRHLPVYLEAHIPAHRCRRATPNAQLRQPRNRDCRPTLAPLAPTATAPQLPGLLPEASKPPFVGIRIHFEFCICFLVDFGVQALLSALPRGGKETTA